LQAEDIEGLLSLGAPKDEYSPEAAELKRALERLGHRVTEDQAAAIVEQGMGAVIRPIFEG
jgi:hypothetical protein